MDRPFQPTSPAQLVAPGHAAGDILDAPDWRLIRREHGVLEVEADLPDRLKNPQGQLFGGFTPTYVDFVSIFTLQTLDLDQDPSAPKSWVTTINMRCDYFEPIVEPTFRIVGQVVNQRGKNALVSTSFFQGETMAAHALTTLRQLDITVPPMSESPA